MLWGSVRTQVTALIIGAIASGFTLVMQFEKNACFEPCVLLSDTSGVRYVARIGIFGP
jgi:hypothetical protein